MKRLCLFLGRLKFHLNMDAFKKKFVNLFKIFFYPVILILWRTLLCFMIQFYFYLDDCIHTSPESPWILLFTKLTGSAGLQNSGKTKQNKTKRGVLFLFTQKWKCHACFVWAPQRPVHQPTVGRGKMLNLFFSKLILQKLYFIPVGSSLSSSRSSHLPLDREHSVGAF